VDNQIDRAEAQRSLVRPAWRRWRWFVASGVLGVTIFVLVWFQPQKLFIDEQVDQPVPTAQPSSASATPDSDSEPVGDATTTTVPADPVDLATGSFVSLDHTASGTVRLLELADGRRFARFEGFETENGPDLFVYLSTNPADGPEAAFDDDFVNLGRLQGNIGDQNYEVPADTDLGRYTSVVVWCDRFDSAFGAADLTSPA
jgi:hypothetical protein